jgi:hypothetical protein
LHPPLTLQYPPQPSGPQSDGGGGVGPGSGGDDGFGSPGGEHPPKRWHAPLQPKIPQPRPSMGMSRSREESPQPGPKGRPIHPQPGSRCQYFLFLSGKGRGEEGSTYRILAGCSSLRRPSRCRSRGRGGGGDDDGHRRRLRGTSWARRRRLDV